MAVSLKGNRLREIEGKAGGRMLAAKGSITDPALAQDMVDRWCKQFGSIDSPVNNAGNTRPAMIAK